MRFIYVSVLFGVFVLHFSGAVVFRFSNLVCLSYNQSWLVIHNCRLKAISRERVTMNANVTILETVNDVQLQYNLYKKANDFKPWLMKGKLDVCRFLRKTYNPLVIMVFNLFKEFTNFNTTCPLLGHKIINGFYLRHELLLLPIPSGEYMVGLRWFFDNKLQFDTNVSFTFVEDMRNN